MITSTGNRLLLSYFAGFLLFVGWQHAVNCPKAAAQPVGFIASLSRSDLNVRALVSHPSNVEAGSGFTGGHRTHPQILVRMSSPLTIPNRCATDGASSKSTQFNLPLLCANTARAHIGLAHKASDSTIPPLFCDKVPHGSKRADRFCCPHNSDVGTRHFALAAYPKTQCQNLMTSPIRCFPPPQTQREIRKKKRQFRMSSGLPSGANRRHHHRRHQQSTHNHDESCDTHAHEFGRNERVSVHRP